MSRLVLVDGNSIMNRAFYGIMGSKMLTASDGTYTNAVYGFLTILFKLQEDLNPDYIGVAFDLKGPTKRHEMYEGYKANRHGMPDELAVQMPIIKNILNSMNIKILEKQGYEGDDILGTISKRAEDDGIDVTILSGDRDIFQLASNKVTIRIPRTRAGKTENEDYNADRIMDEYGIDPEQLIEVKGLMGDTSDNIPGIPGVGEKTALTLIRNYGTIDNLYNEVENNPNLLDVRGKLKEKIIDNKELAYLSKELGKIDREAPIEEKIEDLSVKEWNKPEVYSLFKYLRFNRFIERFNMQNEEEIKETNDNLFESKVVENNQEISKIINQIKEDKKIIYYIETQDSNNSIINKKIKSISIYNSKENKCYYIPIQNINVFKEIFENENIKKIGYRQKEDYILLKESGINPTGFYYDVEIAAYIINPTESKYDIEKLAINYLSLDLDVSAKSENTQINLFDIQEKQSLGEDDFVSLIDYNCIRVFAIYNIYLKTLEKLKETCQQDLFYNIEMPLVEVLADMQFNGIIADKEELIEFGNKLKEEINGLTKNIYKLAGEEFNINSPKQLGVILFEKLKLPIIKKKKTRIFNRCRCFRKT